MEDYIVYTELHDFENKDIQRWYYGTYTHERANEVAYELGQNFDQGIFHSVCPREEAKKFNILNLPY